MVGTMILLLTNKSHVRTYLVRLQTGRTAIASSTSTSEVVYVVGCCC